MKQFTTIVCSMFFAVFGLGLALSGFKTQDIMPTMALNAAPMLQNPVATMPRLPMPFDSVSQAVDKTDTVKITIHDTIMAPPVTIYSNIQPKVKRRVAPVPDVIANKAPTDTVFVSVPVYYLATQVGNKEGPKDKCISVYELQKVDEICPEITNSSTKHVNEHVGAGD